MTGFQKAMRMSVAAGGLAALVGGNVQAATTVTIGDQGFEDHVIDDASGYSYGAASAYGDTDGFNNPDGIDGAGVNGSLGSPWLSLNENGPGAHSGAASWMQTAAYADTAYGGSGAVGNQSVELQHMMAQVLSTTYVAGEAYTFTVDIGTGAGDDSVILYLFDGTALPNPTDDLDISGASSTVASSVLTGTNVALGTGGDVSFTFSAASLAGLVGQNIGIAIADDDLGGQGPGIDNIRLTHDVPEPGSLALLGLGGLLIARRRRD